MKELLGFCPNWKKTPSFQTLRCVSGIIALLIKPVKMSICGYSLIIIRRVQF